MALMSAPCWSMCEAKQCLSTCGEILSAAIPAAAARSRTILNTPCRVKGLPRRHEDVRLGGVALREDVPRRRIVFRKRLRRRAAERNDALLGALAHDPHELSVRHDVVRPERAQLRDAHARAVEHLQDRAVAQVARSASVDAVKHLERLLLGKDLRERAGLLLRVEELGGV